MARVGYAPVRLVVPGRTEGARDYIEKGATCAARALEKDGESRSTPSSGQVFMAHGQRKSSDGLQVDAAPRASARNVGIRCGRIANL